MKKNWYTKPLVLDHKESDSSCISVLAIRTIKIGQFETDISSLIGLSGTIEIDNHADKIVLGREYLLFHNYKQSFDMIRYNPSLGSQ